MSERGVIAVDRGIFGDPMFAPEPFTEREAFIWMIAEAAWKERHVRGAKGPLKLHRGELSHSVRFMADAWSWSKSRVSRYVQRLEKSGTIAGQKRDGSQVYKIKNYNKFQRVGLPDRDTNEPEAGQQRDSSGTAAGQTRNIINIESIETGKEEGDAQARPSFPTREAFDVFCKAVSGTPIPAPKRLTKDREAKLRARLSEHNLAQWEIACRKLAASRFCRGDNERGWVAGIDFILQPKSFNKLIEGQYDNREPIRPAKPKTAAEQLNDYVMGLQSNERHDPFGSEPPVSAFRNDIEGRDERDAPSSVRDCVVVPGNFGAARRG